MRAYVTADYVVVKKMTEHGTYLSDPIISICFCTEGFFRGPELVSRHFRSYFQANVFSQIERLALVHLATLLLRFIHPLAVFAYSSSFILIAHDNEELQNEIPPLI